MSTTLCVITEEFPFFQMKPKYVTTQIKALHEYILMVVFVLLLKTVHFLLNETKRCDHSNDYLIMQIRMRGFPFHRAVPYFSKAH